MSHVSAKKILLLAATFLAVWLFVRFALPLALPFLLGALLALSAEPGVSFLTKKLRLPRSLAAGIGVSAAVVLYLGIFLFFSSVLVRELGQLAQRMPDLEAAFHRGILLLQDFLVGLAGRMPESIRPMLTQLVLDLFSSGTALLSQVTGRVGSMVSGFLSSLPDGFLIAGTGLISGFMISARFPSLKSWLGGHIPGSFRERYLPMLRSLRRTVLLWLKAQLKLSGTTLCIVTGGLLLLRIPYAPLWALIIALVDAVPILGTGTILLPWACIRLLQGDPLQAASLLGIYAAAALVRSVLEPKLIGNHLGLDPLVTLAALYAGYKLWGFGGMILAPVLAVTAMQLSSASQKE